MKTNVSNSMIQNKEIMNVCFLFALNTYYKYFLILDEK